MKNSKIFQSKKQVTYKEGIKNNIVSVKQYSKQKENIIFFVCPSTCAGYLMLLEASTIKYGS